ncbi:Protein NONRESPONDING TO OXYLIPINS 2 [Hirschfeldia incana]|nr:Protein NONRESPONDING TO OXYLIPINS 2 [Hirschfeldia incana]
MASRCRSFSKPAFSAFRSAMNKPSPRPKSTSSFLGVPPPAPGLARPIAQLGSLQSLLPLYSAVASARLTSCLGIDSMNSRSLSQELGLSVPR